MSRGLSTVEIDVQAPEPILIASPSHPRPRPCVAFGEQLTVGEDVVDATKWFPAAFGTAPHVRVGRSRWFNLLWLLPIGFVVLISAVAVAQGLRKIPSVEQFIARYPGTIMSADAHANAGFPALGRGAALLQLVPDDLHHPVRNTDPRGPSAAVLDSALYTGQGVVPLPKGGAGRGVVDREAGLGQLARTDRSSGPSALHRLGALVASRCQYAVGA